MSTPIDAPLLAPAAPDAGAPLRRIASDFLANPIAVAGLALLALVVAADEGAIAVGGNAAALAMLAAWSMRDILGRRAGREDDADLLGVLAIAALLVLLPLVTDGASSLAGLGGGLAGIVLGGWQMGRAAMVAQKKLEAGEGDAAFLRAKIATARFFADHILSGAQGLRSAIVEGSAGVLALDVEQF